MFDPAQIPSQSCPAPCPNPAPFPAPILRRSLPIFCPSPCPNPTFPSRIWCVPRLESAVGGGIYGPCSQGAGASIPSWVTPRALPAPSGELPVGKLRQGLFAAGPARWERAAPCPGAWGSACARGLARFGSPELPPALQEPRLGPSAHVSRRWPGGLRRHRRDRRDHRDHRDRRAAAASPPRSGAMAGPATPGP